MGVNLLQILVASLVLLSNFSAAAYTADDLVAQINSLKESYKSLDQNAQKIGPISSFTDLLGIGGKLPTTQSQYNGVARIADNIKKALKNIIPDTPATPVFSDTDSARIYSALTDCTSAHVACAVTIKSKKTYYDLDTDLRQKMANTIRDDRGENDDIYALLQKATTLSYSKELGKLEDQHDDALIDAACAYSTKGEDGKEDLDC